MFTKCFTEQECALFYAFNRVVPLRLVVYQRSKDAFNIDQLYFVALAIFRFPPLTSSARGETISEYAFAVSSRTQDQRKVDTVDLYVTFFN